MEDEYKWCFGCYDTYDGVLEDECQRISVTGRFQYDLLSMKGPEIVSCSKRQNQLARGREPSHGIARAPIYIY